jgi:hypothetical protein
MGLATLWAIVSPTNPVTLVGCTLAPEFFPGTSHKFELETSSPPRAKPVKTPISISGLPDFPRSKHTKTGKIYQMTTNYTQQS